MAQLRTTTLDIYIAEAKGYNNRTHNNIPLMCIDTFATGPTLNHPRIFTSLIMHDEEGNVTLVHNGTSLRTKMPAACIMSITIAFPQEEN